MRKWFALISLSVAGVVLWALVFSHMMPAPPVSILESASSVTPAGGVLGYLSRLFPDRDNNAHHDGAPAVTSPWPPPVTRPFNPPDNQALDVIADELILGTGSSWDMRRLERLLYGTDIVVIDRMEGWNRIRLRATPAQLQNLFDQVEFPLEHSYNYLTRTPLYLTRTPLTRVISSPFQNPDGYSPIGSNAPRLLGGEDQDSAGFGSDILVAVLDTGVAEHPTIDEARIERIDLVGNNGDGTDSGDYAGHGLAVASLIAGQMGEIPGIAPAVGLLGIRVLDDMGQGDTFTVAKGIITAVDNGADIINLSLGSYGDSAMLREAVDYALANDVLMIAAVGNDGYQEITYPARYQGVLAVSGVDANERHLDFANQGEHVDLAAPAYGINAAWTDARVVSFTGTSAAAPLVTGSLAAILSENPDISRTEAAELLLSYANDTGAPGPDAQYGQGIVDLGRVLNRNQEGIYDVAISGYHLPDPDRSQANIPLLVSIQNRGTEILPAAGLTVSVNEFPHYFYFQDVEQGETVSARLELDNLTLQERGVVEITSDVEIPGIPDAAPGNNVKTTLLSLEPPDQADTGP